MSLYSDVLKEVRRHRLFERARTVVLGVSGGPDSVCLLDVLARMVERDALSVTLHVAHLNHGLRGAEADEDEEFVRALVRRRGLPLTVEKCNVRAAWRTEGGSLEEAARRERYAFLSAVAQEVGAEVVAVGHNADDQVETVLHRILRGAGLKGLRGIPVARLLGDGSAVRLVRPLLGVRRRDILEHLRKRRLAFREDSSNRDRAFTRNRIRGELLPLIEAEYNPAFGESLLRLSRSAADAYELMLDVAHAGVRDCVSGPAIDIVQFGLVHGAVRPLVIDAAVAAAAEDAPQFDAVHYDAVTDLAFEGVPGTRIDLPGGLMAMRTRSQVRFARATPARSAPQIYVPLAVPGRTEVPGAGVAVRAEVVDPATFDLDAFLRSKTRYDEVLDYDAIRGPLVVRSRQNGDRFYPLGAGGRKKVGDFLTDAKAPPEERDRVLLVAAGGEPVWVVGHRIDERAKVTLGTRRLLKLSVRPKGEDDGETRS